MKCNRCGRDLGKHFSVAAGKLHLCWACADARKVGIEQQDMQWATASKAGGLGKYSTPPNSPTVQRAEDLRKGLEVAKLTDFEQATIDTHGTFAEPPDLGLDNQGNPVDGEQRLAEIVVKVRDIAMDARLRTEFLIGYLSDTVHVSAFNAAASIDGALGEIVRETSRAIGPYLPEAPDFRKGVVTNG